MLKLINRISPITLAISTLTIVAVNNSAYAEVYKWRDERGVVQYSDKPPATGFTKASRSEIVNALQKKELCAVDPAGSAAVKTKTSTSSVSANFMGSASSLGFGAPAPVYKGVSVIGTVAAPKPATTVAAPNPTTTAAAPNPTTTAAALNPTTTAAAPKPTTTVAAPKPTTTVAAPKPTTTVAAPKPTTTVAAPKPTTTVAAPKPTTTVAAPKPITIAPAPGVTTLPISTTTTTTATATSTAAASNDGSTGMPKVNLALVPAPAAGKSYVDLIPANHVPIRNTSNNGNNGEFRIGCGYSHMANNDPIVYPGQQGRSHLHTFFGNTGVNENSTNASLVSSGNGTCDGGIMNRSAYWIPSVIDTRDGRPIKPTGANFYYKTGNKNTVKAPPKGLRMITGNASASSGQSKVTYWCSSPGGDDTKHIHSCAVGTALMITIHFPACWDGKNLDSPNHKDHMSFYGSGGCPATHPVQIPDITMNIRYDVKAGDDLTKWRLSSDNYSTALPGGYSIHADWMNGWTDDPVTGVNFAEIFTKHCLQAGMNCGNALLGDGRQYQY